jgi:site-specific DNA-methyltransferase (adenine-specific)
MEYWQSMILMQGDCLERMKEIPDGSVDMVLADPPYGTTACKWDSVIPLDAMWAQLKRIIKPNGAIVMTASQPFTTTLIASNLAEFNYCLVWEKERPSNPAIANRQFMKWHEDICIFGRPATYLPQMVERDKKNIRNNKLGVTHSSPTYGALKLAQGDGTKPYRHPSSVIKINVQRGIHPTQKPVALMEYLIRTYTNKGETVLDFTMGSGTTGVACSNTNRHFIGIEKDETYFAIAKNRIETAQAKAA